MEQQILGFRCKTCNKEIDCGECGQHRQETGHEDFWEVLAET